MDPTISGVLVVSLPPTRAPGHPQDTGNADVERKPPVGFLFSWVGAEGQETPPFAPAGGLGYERCGGLDTPQFFKANRPFELLVFSYFLGGSQPSP